jgi:hypothetical protein
MNLELIEYVIFAVIIAIQFWFFFKTKRKIKDFNKSIAEISNIQIADMQLTEDQINTLSSRADIFDSAKQYLSPSVESIVDDPDEEVAEYVENEDEPASPIVTMSDELLIKVRLVESSENTSLVFNQILNSLNKYLLRNRHSVADFSLVKDIVERNTDTLEEEVNLTLSTPLYIGLMGTMLGVVIGIFSMSNFIGAEIKDDGISTGIGILLGSVKIAMIASFVGLLLTIYNSAVVFKGSKYRLENKKNDFYSMIQVELLPTLNQGVGATFDSLQRNLFKFNQQFDSNLDRLGNVFDRNYESILLQKKVVEMMDKSKVADITNYNVKVLNEMNRSLEQFDKFNVLFSNINGYISNSYLLADRSSELLQRTGNFEKIAMSIEANLSESTKLSNFLSGHFQDLERHKTKIDESIVDVSFNIKDTFSQLSTSLQQSSQVLNEEAVSRNQNSKNLFDDFSNSLKESLNSQALALSEMLAEKKSSLDYLKHLETLVTEVKVIKGNNTDTSSLANQIQELNSGIQNCSNILKRIEVDAKKPFYKKLFIQK